MLELLRLTLARILGVCYWYADHAWVYDEHNAMKRTCSVCDRHEWAFMRPYPSATEPTIKWRRMYYNGS